MKPAFRIILPVVVGITILGGIALFLEQRPESLKVVARFVPVVPIGSSLPGASLSSGSSGSSGNSGNSANSGNSVNDRKPSSQGFAVKPSGQIDPNSVAPASSILGAPISPAHPQGAELAPGKSSSATSSTGAGPTAKAVVAPAPPQPICFLETFHHKPTAGHNDEESCAHHKNLIKLSHANINPAHICVKVNGTPVKFTRNAEASGDEILIGSIAGPQAKITASYCVGKQSCAAVTDEACKIPKDEFMDALQGEDPSAADAEPNTHWEGTQAAADANLNSEVKKELADINEVGTGDESSGRVPASANVFKDWINEEDAPVCSKNQAS